MPQYFDLANLTPEQKANWDSAMHEYARIQEANVVYELESMTKEEKAELLALFREDNPEDQRSLREHMNALRGLMGGQAGHPKSALFARLLEGKPALPFPPPTSYSYPWYAVVEELGVFNVSIGGVSTVAGQMRGTGGAKGQFVIGINQCAWAVVSLNDAASRLLQLQDAINATAVPEKEGSPHDRYAWTPALLEGVLAAYAARPEFSVRFGSWAEYSLRIGRGESVCQRQHLQDVVAKVEARQCDNLSTCGNVFDIRRFYLNHDVGGAEAPQTDFVRMTCDDWVLERAPIPVPY